MIARLKGTDKGPPIPSCGYTMASCIWARIKWAIVICSTYGMLIADKVGHASWSSHPQNENLGQLTQNQTTVMSQVISSQPRRISADLPQPNANSNPIQECRELVADLFTHKPWIYWTDMLLTLAVGYGAGLMYLEAPAFSIQQLIYLSVAGFALFRVGSYVHEITHMRHGQMLSFRVAWNLLAGIPMVMP
jgi:hypothetical protein